MGRVAAPASSAPGGGVCLRSTRYTVYHGCMFLYAAYTVYTSTAVHQYDTPCTSTAWYSSASALCSIRRVPSLTVGLVPLQRLQQNKIATAFLRMYRRYDFPRLNTCCVCAFPRLHTQPRARARTHARTHNHTPHRRLAPELARLTRPGGRVGLSGVLESQVPGYV
jgi:hypothetical protein